MFKVFQSLAGTVALGVALLVAALVLVGGLRLDHVFAALVVRWLHVLCAVMWLGLLFYFNFVQTPSMPRIPDEHKPAITRVVAPQALFWFRYAALATVATGLALAWMNGYLWPALALRSPAIAIGIGMWLALVMAANVWFVIWPAQQKALGLAIASTADRAKAARRAGWVSRLNLALAVPMVFFMVAQARY